MLRVSASASALGMLVASAITACSLIVDTDGLENGNGNGDAGPTIDASSDAAIDKDGSSGIDAGPGSDASAPPFCVSHPGHTICLDFDESLDIPVVDNASFDPGHIFIDNAASVSPEQSLAILFSPGTGSNEQIEKNLTGTKGVLSWAFDVRFSASDLTKGQTIPLATFVPLSPGLSQHFFYLQTYAGDLDLTENVTPDDGGPSDYPGITLISPVPADTWMHIEMSVDGTTQQWTMSFNGVALANQQAEVGFPIGPGAQNIGGYGSSDIPVSTTVHIDNLLIDY
jgi:hypothetical protein